MGMRYMLYIAWNKDKYIVNLSHDPVLDLNFHMDVWGCQQLWILTPPLLLGQAYFILNSAAVHEEIKGTKFSGRDSSIKGIARYLAGKIPFTLSHGNQLKEKYDLVQHWLVRLGLGELDEPQLITCSNAHVNRVKILEKRQEANAILPCLEGRYVLADEAEALLNYSKINIENPLEDLLQILSLQHKAEVFPGVGQGKKRQLKCFRCGSSENLKQSYCLECGSNDCWYCEDCISMGESRECMQLYGFPHYSKPIPKQVEIHFDFELTPAQKDAAVNVWKFAKSSELNKCLVWAACGAGKTEVSFPCIADALKRGCKVLFAVPRKDTIIDIEKRVRKCFSGVEIAALYGGSGERFKRADLILATTHQVLRFYEAFHLVILDEVDAFPYHGSTMLYNALNRALHPRGKIIYMTATPPPYLLKMDRSTIEIVTIPARHHGYPLPVPEIIIDKSLQLKDNDLVIPEKVLGFLHESIEGEFSQVLIFVPTIFLSERVGEILKKAFELPPFNNFGGNWVDYTHSQDPERDKKREGFLKGEFPVLVTTTLMERGINVPKVNVIVLFAENQYIFDTATLVQMAGRAGRMTDNPSGKVWFIGSQTTPFMKQAISWIKSINKEAADKGYLKRLPNTGRLRVKNVK
ncbi:DEAD/DEAH box helicase [Desulfitibacter alkalitolerans]|uniref:DEAD/DEAH box helicase n=1 Tax=Desulfitibacter alkalitolerans TaxID=264641 RepID=UPI000688ACE4|nr:DEAD/DEAH box helicase [Desulfitibacter alkalitolerans]